MPLPVPPDSMRVRFNVALLNGEVIADQAQFGFWGVRKHVVGSVVDWPDDVQYMAEGIRQRWIDSVPNKGAFSTGVRFDSVAVDHLEAATGKVLDQGVALFTGANAWRGSAEDSLPWETSLAVSLYNYEPGEFARDKPRRRGRFYLPPMSTIVATRADGQFDSAFVTEICGKITTFLNAVQGSHFNDTPGNDGDYFDLSIVSRGTTVKPLPPTAYPVNFVRIDSKVDSQRRRERQQPAASVASGVVDHA